MQRAMKESADAEKARLARAAASAADDDDAMPPLEVAKLKLSEYEELRDAFQAENGGLESIEGGNMVRCGNADGGARASNQTRAQCELAYTVPRAPAHALPHPLPRYCSPEPPALRTASMRGLAASSSPPSLLSPLSSHLAHTTKSSPGAQTGASLRSAASSWRSSLSSAAGGAWVSRSATSGPGSGRWPCT